MCTEQNQRVSSMTERHARLIRMATALALAWDTGRTPAMYESVACVIVEDGEDPPPGTLVHELSCASDPVPCLYV